LILIIPLIELILQQQHERSACSTSFIEVYNMAYFSSTSLLSLMQSLHNADIGILKAIFENRISAIDPVFVFITNSAAAIAFGVPVILLLFSFQNKIIQLRYEAVSILIPVAISAILANMLKYVFDTPRPYEVYTFIHKLSVGGSPSFPSGHTADAFSFAVAMILVYRKWLIALPVLVWASLVGYSRMYLGVHFPSDVLGGALIGTVCSYAYIFYAKRKYLNSNKTSHTRLF
jgi:membrane-associated phospholipid phosphatase